MTLTVPSFFFRLFCFRPTTVRRHRARRSRRGLRAENATRSALGWAHRFEGAIPRKKEKVAREPGWATAQQSPCGAGRWTAATPTTLGLRRMTTRQSPPPPSRIRRLSLSESSWTNSLRWPPNKPNVPRLLLLPPHPLAPMDQMRWMPSDTLVAPTIRPCLRPTNCPCRLLSLPPLKKALGRLLLCPRRALLQSLPRYSLLVVILCPWRWAAKHQHHLHPMPSS